MTYTDKRQGYAPPALEALGSLHDLTQICRDKTMGSSDGLNLDGAPIQCKSSA